MASPSEDLQKAVYDFLTGDADISAIIGSRVYDGVPDDATAPFVAFGASDFVDAGANCIDGIMETLQLDVICENQSRLRDCKALTWLIMSKLRDATLTLATHALADLQVSVSVVRPDPDGITAHGILQVSASIEEA